MVGGRADAALAADGPGALRLAVRKALAEAELRSRAGEIASWAAANDGAERGAELVEALARS